ncbi:hypothetical protein V8G54_013365 [Vigna mungo]|uniref:Uncharacterized protein n=1 Tax=Vigna mungo TaxID=3915 RepID=A0AAQ3S4V2_VIGMU
MGKPWISYSCANSFPMVASTLAKTTPSSLSSVATAAYSGARAWQWPHQGDVELDHDKAVVLDDGGEIVLLQNDNVFVVHRGLLERLLGGGVEAGEIVKVVVFVFIVVEVVGI